MDFVGIIASIFISLGGATGIALIIINKYGNKIVDNQFEKAIENYRYKINSRFDRISKIHEKEFEFLPNLWDKTLEANTKLRNLNNPSQDFHDIENMSNEEVMVVLNTLEIPKIHIGNILESNNRMDLFSYYYFIKKYNMASKAISDFDYEYHKNRIFLTENIENDILKIRKIFLEVDSLLFDAIKEEEIDKKMVVQSSKIHEIVNITINELAEKIKVRLKFNEVF